MSNKLVVSLTVLLDGSSVKALTVPNKIGLAEVAGPSSIHFVLALSILLITISRVERTCRANKSECAVVLEQSENPNCTGD